MIRVQWNENITSRKWLEARGWRFVRQVTDGWIEMELGSAKGSQEYK